jgi:hypothetical protein
MCAANKQSLEVSFQHLSNAAPMLAIWVADMPAQMLRLFDTVAEQVVRSEFEECESNAHLPHRFDSRVDCAWRGLESAICFADMRRSTAQSMCGYPTCPSQTDFVTSGR